MENKTDEYNSFILKKKKGI
jgi:hypothetical protein